MIAKERIREAPSAGKHNRLEKVFEHAKKNPNAFDYATELLAQCVIGEPGNIDYVRAYIENLQKKYHNQKISSLARFRELAARNGMKKALADEQWQEVIQHGLKVLTANPCDVSALAGLAAAAGRMGHRQCELHYLQTAVAGSPKNPTCNRLYAIALTERGKIDQAIAFWHRVEEVRPNDDEAQRSIAALTVEKAASGGRFDEFKEDEIEHRLRLRAQEQEETTRERTIQQKIQSEPNKVAHYLELAQLYLNDERYEDAENVLAQAFEVSGGDTDIREKWEDVQLRRLRQKMAMAQDSEVKNRLRREYFEKDMEVCRHRVERHPNNLRLKYDLGYRYLLTGRYMEAIQQLQVATNDPHRKGVSLLLLGQCFHHIKEYRLALSHYESAVREIPGQDTDNRKLALYLAGRLALALGDLEAAENHLTVLGSLDFSYRDSAALLDKVRKAREDAAYQENVRRRERAAEIFGRVSTVEAGSAE